MADTPKTTARGWLALAGAAMALFCTVGFLNAFGVFQQYYTTYLPDRSPSDISWIGSLSIFLLYSISPFGGLLVDRIGPTLPLCLGSLGLVLALFLASLCTQYWQLMLAQALLLGASASMVFCPPLGVVLRHMPHRRGLAMGLTIGGSSIGGIVWPILLQNLLVRVGFGWTIRVLAFVMLPLLAFTCIAVREPSPTSTPSSPSPSPSPSPNPNRIEIEPESSSPLPPSQTENQYARSSDSSMSVHADKEAPTRRAAFLAKPTYVLLCLGLAVAYLGLFTPLFYISTYAIAQGHVTSTAFYLLSAANASSFFGRVLPGYMADKLGHFNLLILFTLLSGLVGLTWTKATGLAELIVWSLAFGFTSGAVMSLQNACAGKMAPPQAQGLSVGVLMGCLSITALVGTPISGQILSHSGYLALSVWTGATLLAGGAILGLARFLKNPKLLAAF